MRSDQKMDKYNNLISTIKQLGQLEKDWNSYDADPPNQRSIDNAIRFLEICKTADFLPLYAAPSADGGLGFVFMDLSGFDRKYSDVEFFNDGDILAIISSESSTSEVWRILLGTQSAIETIEKIRTFKESTSLSL